MPSSSSTPTSRLRLLQQPFGANPDAWGAELNAGGLGMTDDAFGVSEVAVGANVTLTVENYITDQARSLVLVLTGAGGFTVTAPAVDKPYLVVNQCAADVTLTPSGGSGAVVRAASAVWWYCDGTDGFIVDPALNEIKTATGDVALGGFKLTGVANPTSAQDASTKAYVDGEITTSEARPLNTLTAPSASLSLNSQKITNLANGTNAADAVNRGQLDAIAGAEATASAAAASAAASLAALNQKITISTQAPDDAVGSDGDLWFRIS
jgi:hypothetical protein